MVFIAIAALVGGYIASIYTWPKVHVWAVGVETAVRSLEDRITAIRAKL